MAEAGIAGRGVLLDYYSFAQQHGKPYNPQDTHPISVADLEACRKAQGTELKPGDILLIRVGMSCPPSKLMRRIYRDVQHAFDGG
jgi:hypothetical protein